MPSLQRTKVKGHTYYRIVESRRVNGKPRPIPILHLGTVDQILERMLNAPQGISKLQSFQHGDVAALKAMADSLGVSKLIDRHAKPTKRKISVGDTLLLAAINRAVRPRSKRAFADWAKGTSLSRLFDLDTERLTSQFFWDQMDALSEEAVEKIEDEIARKVVDLFKIEPKTLFYDTTNFFTYIASANMKSSLAERGRNKQKRTDLRQFSLALLVSRDGQIPLFSHVYEGNKVDVKVFPDVLSRLKARLGGLFGPCEEPTLVYDKGNNSKANQILIDDGPFSFVTSLTPSHHSDLLVIPAADYLPLAAGPLAGLPIVRLRREIWGKERTLVLLISEKLRTGQIRGFEQQLIKRLRLLCDWKLTLAKPRSGPRSAKNAAKRIEEILEGQHIKDVLKVRYYPRRKGESRLMWELDLKAKAHLETEVFGKRFLMTDRHDWESDEIVRAYKGMSKVEAAFRQLKNVEHLALRPQYHWTDQKVRVHAFICMLALILTRLLERRVQDLGLHLSPNVLLEKLASIRLAMILRSSGKKGGRPKAEWMLEHNEDGEALEIFHQLVPQEKPFVYTQPQ